MTSKGKKVTRMQWVNDTLLNNENEGLDEEAIANCAKRVFPLLHLTIDNNLPMNP